MELAAHLYEEEDVEMLDAFPNAGLSTPPKTHQPFFLQQQFEPNEMEIIPDSPEKAVANPFAGTQIPAGEEEEKVQAVAALAPLGLAPALAMHVSTTPTKAPAAATGGQAVELPPLCAKRIMREYKSIASAEDFKHFKVEFVGDTLATWIVSIDIL